MLRLILNSLKFTVVVTGAVFLSTLAINASDSFMNPSNSMLGSAISGIVKRPPCPDGSVYVGAPGGSYCIDMYEASPGSSCDNKNPVSQAETRINIESPACIPVSVKGAIPWRNISQDQATRACAKAGKRLPTNEQWFFAALGTPDPSEGWKKSDCNVERNRDANEPALSGSGEKCVSSLGAHDMIGNVWEWVGETVKEGTFDGAEVPDSGYVTGSDEHGIPSATNATTSDENYSHDRFWVKKENTVGMFRGGFWGSGSDAGIYSVHAEMRPSFTGDAIGFRCVKEAGQ